jgi:hypothetical protein
LAYQLLLSLPATPQQISSSSAYQLFLCLPVTPPHTRYFSAYHLLLRSPTNPQLTSYSSASEFVTTQVIPLLLSLLPAPDYRLFLISPYKLLSLPDCSEGDLPRKLPVRRLLAADDPPHANLLGDRRWQSDPSQHYENRYLAIETNENIQYKY